MEHKREIWWRPLNYNTFHFLRFFFYLFDICFHYSNGCQKFRSTLHLQYDLDLCEIQLAKREISSWKYETYIYWPASSWPRFVWFAWGRRISLTNISVFGRYFAALPDEFQSIFLSSMQSPSYNFKISSCENV